MSRPAAATPSDFAQIGHPDLAQRTITVATHVTLDADIDDVWREIQKPALLAYVTKGLMRFDPMDSTGFPEIWGAREYCARLYAYGLIPIGRQIIGIERPQPQGDRRFLRDNGRGDLCRRWDHLMTLEPLPDGRTRYIDTVTVEAGLLTAPIAAFAWSYYFLRQRRLKRAAANGFVY